jgi:hypothetical protein
MPPEPGLFQIVHACPPQRPVAQEKARRLDDVHAHVQTGAQPQQSASILRNIGLEKGQAHQQAGFSLVKYM